ncbi:hypothetical protein KHA80_18840 [Anaerobacillus sp. HL2]|nr:hypothetical protein KHA80_18840 [Anaerobacillus sp. HL2]
MLRSDGDRMPHPTISIPKENYPNETWTVEKMVEYLSFLKNPILDAEISTFPNHLPGARRAYRNGYHEGIDLVRICDRFTYNSSKPRLCNGRWTVVRADHDYQEYQSAEIRNRDLAITTELAETPIIYF